MTHSMVELRKERNITQEELASEIGMSKGAIGMYETGKRTPSLKRAKQIQPQFLGVGAMQNLFSYINQVRKLNGTLVKPEVLGILFTMVRINTNNDRDVMAYFRDSYQGKINMFDTYIPNSVRISESDGEGESIFKYAPKTSAAMVYGDLIEEFIKIEGK